MSACLSQITKGDAVQVSEQYLIDPDREMGTELREIWPGSLPEA